MRVLIAPDKFKGTLTARQAAWTIARGWKRICPGDVLELRPISDGGDGFGSVLAELQGARPVQMIAVDAAGRQCRVRWWWDASSRTAIIESARVIGLAMLPVGKFHPFELDTTGLAAVLRRAAQLGAKRCIVGIGGSATNDGGFGLARGLGWRFLDAGGKAIECWTDLARLTRLVPPIERGWPKQITVAVDVGNPLLGARGCTHVFGPQKGLCPADFARAEACLRRLSRVAERTLGSDAKQIGAGAAGGLGFGLATFVGASLTPGFDFFANCAHLDAMLRRADLVITGEGRLDRSTLMGKGVGELARRCRKLGVPCIAFGGNLADRPALARRFEFISSLTELTAPHHARARAGFWLSRLATRAAELSRAIEPTLAAREPLTIVSHMNLEDHLGDIIRKARSMTKVTVPAAAAAAGLSVTEFEALEQTGRSVKQPDVDALAALVRMSATKLAGIANGWLPAAKNPELWCELRVITTRSEDFSVNCYLAWDEVTREGALFDTGLDCVPINQLIEMEGLQLRHVFITHDHSDHVACLPEIRAKFPKAILHMDAKNALPQHKNRRNDCIQLGSLRITNRETPGHAVDGVTYIVGNWPKDAAHVAIVGDAIFAGSIGLAPGDWELARQKVREQILALPADTLLCPGHGPLTTVAEEWAHNPFF